jgi:cobalt-zinc-cadmium efflux system outer membrane protein
MYARLGRARVALALALALSACATRQSEHYDALRARLETAPPARAGGDDPFAGSAELTRAGLVELVLARNPDVATATAAARAALARYPQETALADPMFGYAARPASFSSSEVDPANDFELSQAVPFPGKLALRGERALAEADAAATDVDATRLRLAALASQLFDAYWLAERALETNAEQQALIDQAHAAALARYSTGTGTLSDALGAETERAMLLHRQIELESERTILAERISTLLHRPPGRALPAPPRELEPVVSAHELDPAVLLTRALEQRPELRALAAEVRAREAEVALARREFWPDFTVRAGYEGSWQEDPLKPVVGVELNLPLQLGRRRAALAEADARLAREQSRARRLEDRVRLEVATSVERLRESQHLLELSEERLLPAARDRAAAARASFTSGRTSFLELLDAERALRAAQQSAFEARAGLSSRRAELARVVGDLPIGGEELP